MVRAFAALTLLAASLHAGDACQPPAGLDNIEAAEARVPKFGVLAPEYAKLAAENDFKPPFLFLYGRALMGKDTPKAIEQFQRAISSDPGFPWPYQALTDVYSSRNFGDPAKLLENARTFRKLCPEVLAGFTYIDKISDPAESLDWAKALRPLLEKSTNPKDARFWRMLWAAEFRGTAKSEYPALREKVAADVKWLESQPQDRSVLGAIWDGYKLSEQTEAAQRVYDRLNMDSLVYKTYEEWSTKRGMRGNLTSKEWDAAFLDYAKVTKEWVKQWPESTTAWSLRLAAMNKDPEWTRKEEEKVGDRWLELDAAHPMNWTDTPAKLRVAQHWVPHGIRLQDSVRMDDEALDEILRGPQEFSDWNAPPNAAQVVKVRQFGYDTAVWDAMNTIVDGAIQLKDFDKARKMVARMLAWLETNQTKKDDATTGYNRFQSHYLVRAAKLADAEGHRMDAAALYTKAMAWGASIDTETRQHARALWDEAGGTRDGWSAATRRVVAPNPAKPTPIGTATEYAAWQRVDRPLPMADLLDPRGAAWNTTNLKGKTTFVNVFATWCAPCRDELPQVQKLYELSRQRGDFQVLVLSVDENPGEIQPFLKSNGYTFPVILAREYVENVVGPFTIPQNWIVDPAAKLREKSIGFDNRVADWSKQMADRTVTFAK